MTEKVVASSSSSSSSPPSSPSSSPPSTASTLRPWLNLLALGLGFTFVFTSFNALQNLESSLFLEHSDPGIGLYTLSVIYVFAAIGCTIAPFVLQIVGTKSCLIFGAVSHALFTAAHFCSSHFTLLPAGALLGLATGVVWPSQGKSVTKFAEEVAAAKQQPVEPVVSLFNGIFFCLFMSSQIWGNLISKIVLEKTDSSSTVDVSHCGANLCPEEAEAAISNSSNNSSSSISFGSCETPDSAVQTIFAIFLVSVGVGLVLWAVLPNLSRLSKAERGPTDCRTISAALVGGLVFTFQDQRALLLAPMFFYTGLEQAILAGNYYEAFVTCVIGIDNVGLVAMTFGIADAVASLVAGRAAKLTGQSGMIAIGIVIQAALLPLMLLKTPGPDERWLLYITAGFWGVADAIWQTQTSSMMGVVFNEHQESAFACWRLWQQLGFAFSFAFSASPVCTNVSLWIGLGVLGLSALGLGAVEVKKRRGQRENEARGGGGKVAQADAAASQQLAAGEDEEGL